MSVQTPDPPFLLDEPGVYDMPEAAYHADPLRHLGGSLSSTIARKLLAPSCPALARYALDHPEYKDAYDLGSVTHRLILGAGCEIVEVAAKDWTAAGKAGRAAKEQARERGAVALLSKDLATAQAMRDAVYADDLASALLTAPGAPERVLLWREGAEQTWGRAMVDRWPDPSDADVPPMVDVKTTAKGLDDDSLQGTIWSYGYGRQEDWYRRGYRAVHGVEADFWFVFVSDSAPYLVRCVQVDDALREMARRANDEALAVWRDCIATDTWPGYPSAALIGPPRWARTREDY